MIQRDHGVYKPTTTETPMRERLKAALDRFHRNSCYPDAMDFELDAAADAVLDAMREPSSVQRRAAQKAHDKWGASSSMLLSDLFNDIWRAMLNAAKEGK